MRTAGDGATVSDHMAVVNSYPGKASAAAAEAPPFPEPLKYLWGAYQELAAARQSGMGLSPIGFGDIDAYARLCDMRLEPWEVRVIRRVDVAFITTVSSDGVGAA